MRPTVLAAALLTTLTAAASLVDPAPAGADPLACEGPECVPGIAGHVILGGPCVNTTHYVFGTTDWGRLVFCGSPRRYAPRYFRSPPMEGIRVENTNCTGFENSVAQAPDGLFLSCVAASGESLWVRGDNS